MNSLLDTSCCQLCPRTCKVNRQLATGFCGCTNEVKVARAALHMWEEPCISGKKGSGTVFFSGCTLKCCFCQNFQINCENFGKILSASQLSEVFLKLQEEGAHNLNLVTPTQYLPFIIEALDKIKSVLSIPVIYNCGGYERPEIISLLKDYVDIYMPDLKYYDTSLSFSYSKAKDYFFFASKAILKMVQQTGTPVFNEDGILQKGVLIRHLVLPGCKEDSVKLLEWLSETLPKGSFLLSLLSQYTPVYKAREYPKINRRITTYEYNKVLDKAIALGLDQGFMQERSSASSLYTPSFHLEGLDTKYYFT